MPPPLHRVASHRWQPEIVVGVDFGMTCTGVAWVKINFPNEPDVKDDKKSKSKSKMGATSSVPIPEPTNIQKWLGLHSMQLIDKVPTELIYSNPEDQSRDKVLAWGMYCRGKEDAFHHIKRLFKLNIAAKAEHEKVYGHTTEEARRYFQDYITKVCGHVDDYLFSRVPGYRAMRVEYVFSVPTSWMFDFHTLGEVRRVIRDVVGNTQSRRAVIGLSEAVAAAIDIGRGQYKKNDVILVCDIGGGTTDVNIVKVISAEDSAVDMKALTYDEGIEVGSTRIDQAVINYITDILGGNLSSGGLEIVRRAVYHDFQEIKHEYGTAGSDRQFHSLPLLGLSGWEKLPPDQFDRDSLRIPGKELRCWFDEQIDKIIEVCEKQIQKLQLEHKKENLSWVVLSGGFGLNQYVRDRLKSHLNEMKKSKDSPIDTDVKVLSAVNPQLAVVRGLVYNRTQELMGSAPVYSKVCCQQSYGIVVREEYNKSKHKQQPDEPRISKTDGKMWMYGQVDWIIEQGVLIDSAGGRKSYKWLLTDEEEEEEVWYCEVVSCAHSRERLPRNISHNSVKTVCKVQLDMNKLTVTKGKRNWLGKQSKSKNYKVIEFDLLMLVGAADIRFQIHPVGECDTLASLEHEEVDVVWMPNTETAKVEIAMAEQRQPIASKRKSQHG